MHMNEDIELLKASIMKAIDIRKGTVVLQGLERAKETIEKIDERIEKRTRKLTHHGFFNQLLKGIAIAWAASNDHVSTFSFDANHKAAVEQDRTIQELKDLRETLEEFIRLENDYFAVIDAVGKKMDESNNFVFRMANLVLKWQKKPGGRKGDAFFAECAKILSMDIGNVMRRVEKASVYLDDSFYQMLNAEADTIRTLYEKCKGA